MSQTHLLLSEKEVQKLTQWLANHKPCMQPRDKRIELITSQTGVGTAIRARCWACVVTDDLSDYDSW
jgi:hypothetical protein